MSIVDDQLRRIDAQLDRFQLTDAKAEAVEQPQEESANAVANAQAAKLKTLIRSLSTTAGSRPLLRRRRLRDTIAQIQRPEDVETTSTEETYLQWLATAKATAQLYGIILNTLLDQTIPLSESIWYWDDILGSYVYTALYTLQTSPVRAWDSTKEIYADAKNKYQSNTTVRQAAQESGQSLSAGWKEFYGLVQQSIQDRSLAQARRQILSPFAICRSEAKKKQTEVKKLREQSATAIGLLVFEGLNFPPDQPNEQQEDWRLTVSKSVGLLESLVGHTSSMTVTLKEFEDNVIEGVQCDGSETPAMNAKKLIQILDTFLPDQENQYRVMAADYGKPSRFIRYWMPGLALFLSGGTLLRIFVNRKEAILSWFRELGQTTIDFWFNWVVEPTKKLIGTIRHDQNSELAIMSKDSLRTDRESLERMVVDFAVQNPDSGSAYNDTQIAEIRAKVKEGDLTPVLRAYERDLQSPAKGVLFGNLTRALLIQVQKTKVDVEVAMSGIDSILKSQELLFGFVGIAPGMAISYLVIRWLSSTLGGRKGLRQSQSKGESVRLLRNINRTLSNAVPNDNDVLSYKDYGLLLCEVHVLRQRAAALLPGNVQREFLEDINDLMQISSGVPHQLQVLQRMQWAYAAWLR